MGYVQTLSYHDFEGNLVIDWSAGPDDAQYYSPESDNNYEGFMKVEGRHAYFSTKHDGYKVWVFEMALTGDDVRNDPALIKKEQE